MFDTTARVTVVSAVTVFLAAWLLAGKASAVRHPKSLVVFGSSSINGSFGRLIAKDFARMGFRVSRHGYSSAGFARPDFLDIRETLEQLPIDENTAAVLLYLGTNDAQSLWSYPAETSGRSRWISWKNRRWTRLYEARARSVIGSLCARRVQHAIVMSPVDVMRPRLQTRLERIRPALRNAAVSTTCGHFVSTAGDEELFEAEGDKLRAPDGVHMTRAGATRVWSRVRDEVLSLMNPGKSAERRISSHATLDEHASQVSMR